MLKSRKRLAIILTVISVFVVLLVLGSALFSLQHVTIEFAVLRNESSVLATYNKEEMVKTGNFSYGKNILFLNFESNMARIEEAYPYAKVVKVERKFPNNAIVYIVEREPMFKVIQPDNSYYILDADLKILKHATGVLDDVDGNLPEWNSFPLTTTQVGSFVSNDYLRNVIININAGVVDNDVNLNISIISSINLENIEGSEDELLTLVLNDQVTIKITGTNNLAEKVLGALNRYQLDIQGNSNKYPDMSAVTITVTKNFTLDNDVGIAVSGGVSSS